MTKNSLASAILAIGCLMSVDRSGAMDATGSAARLAAAGGLAGELIELKAGNRGFVALYSAQELALPGRGAAVLLHDQGTHLNSHEVIRPLRLGLSAAGWDSLALALPTGYAGATRTQWLGRDNAMTARLQAGIDWLATRELSNFVIVALGDSAPVALRFAKDQQPAGLRALVIISSALYNDGPIDELASLGELQLPVLDIYAERDAPHITSNAALRRRAAAANPKYRQATIADAVAGYAGLEDNLLHRIRAWLATQAGDRPDKQ